MDDPKEFLNWILNRVTWSGLCLMTSRSRFASSGELKIRNLFLLLFFVSIKHLDLRQRFSTFSGSSPGVYLKFFMLFIREIHRFYAFSNFFNVQSPGEMVSKSQYLDLSRRLSTTALRNSEFVQANESSFFKITNFNRYQYLNNIVYTWVGLMNAQPSGMLLQPRCRSS